MNGKSHFTIGCCLGIAVAYVGFKHGDAALAATAITCPVGAMLPDIDHNNSKIGKQRKHIVDTIKKATAYVGLSVFGFTVFTNWVQSGTFGLSSLLLYGLLPALVTYLPIILCIRLSTSAGVKKRFKFFSKHRGIMHTLWPMIGLLFGAITIEYMFVSVLLTGLAVGYLSHLLADCETVMGCPILWPLVQDNISIFKITTGTKAESFVLALDLLAISLVAYVI